MKFEIKNRWNSEIIFSLETESLKVCLETAIKSETNLYEADLRGANLRETNLRGANLRGANLYGADLYEANLRGADLYGADIDGEVLAKNPIQIPCGLQYVALITDSYMRLGCKRYTHAEWVAFDDEQITAMDGDALVFWKQWREPLLAMCKAHSEGV